MVSSPSNRDDRTAPTPPDPTLRDVIRYLLGTSFLRHILSASLLLVVIPPLISRYLPDPAVKGGGWPLLVMMGAGLLVVVVASLYRAARAMLIHRRVDAVLQRSRDELASRLEDRTRDLLQTNKALTRKIDDGNRVEAALRASEARFRLLIETIPNPVFFKDSEGVFLGCNAAYSETLGLPKEQIIGRTLVDLPGVANRDMAEHYHHQDLALIRNPGIQVHEEQTICADGVMRDFMLFKATFRDEEGAVAGLVGVMLDISERKKMERALKESQGQFDAFMEHLPGLAFIKNLEGCYIYVNRAFSEFVGSAPDGPIGLHDNQVWDPETAHQLQSRERFILEGKSAASVVETIQRPGQPPRFLLTTRFPIYRDTTLVALGGVAIDITEHTEAEQRHRQLERQLQQAQKMEALGTLAGGIAHDFNNILAAVIGYTQIALADIPKDAAVRPYLTRVLEAGERAGALVRQILTFSRKTDTEPQPVQVRVIVKEVMQLVRATLGVTVTIVQHLNSDATVMADPVQIHQIMMNLCANAGYAMRDQQGTLTVELEDVTLEESFARLHADLIKPGPHVRLSVADTGPGIAPEHLGRIFDPFFTTKPKGVGTGMGLSVVHAIVTRLGGVITVESSPGKGARFDLYLPTLPHAPVPMKHPAGALPQGTERILLVDDEIFQTDMFKQMLGLLGYKVETRNNGHDALTLFEADPHAFDLVISDVMMPGMRGDDLAVRMLAGRPDLPIILCTGFGEHLSAARADAIGIRAFALKPLAMEDLAHLIRKVLDAPANERATP